MRKRPHREVADLRRADQRRREVLASPLIGASRIALVADRVQPRLHHSAPTREQRDDSATRAQRTRYARPRPAPTNAAEQQQRRERERSRASPTSARAARSGNRTPMYCCSVSTSCTSPTMPVRGTCRMRRLVRDTAAPTSRIPRAAARRGRHEDGRGEEEAPVRGHCLSPVDGTPGTDLPFDVLAPRASRSA